MKQVKCVVCRKRTQPSGRRIVKEEVKNHLQKKSFVEVKEGDCICSKCLLRFYRTVQPEDPSDYGYDDNDDEEYIPPKRKRVDPPQSPRTVSVAIPSTSKSHAYCFVCRKPGPKLIVVSSQLRLSVFVGHNILIPEGSRCCPGHVKDGTFSTEIVKQLKTTSPTVLSEDSVGDILQKLRDIANRNSSVRLDLSICTDPEADVNLACKMLYMSKQNNTLKSYVEDNGLDKRSAKWKSADEVHLSEFPQLDEQQLRDLTCGTYQLKLSSSYLQEHVDGESQIHLHEEEPNLLRIRIQSRHVSAKTYLLWIKYDSSSIQSWYCKCRAGTRVVGVCAHIACMLWYLGLARVSNQGSCGVKYWGEFLNDAAMVPEVVDESDNESIASVTEE